jgi:hypothetical protein
VLNREITITNNLIYFLNLSSSILLSQSWLVQTSTAMPTYQFVTLTETSLRLCFCINQFHPQTSFRQSNLCNHNFQFIKKNKEEGNSVVDYKRYCYTTAFRDVNWQSKYRIIITCACNARIPREREFPFYLISIDNFSATHCPLLK